MKEKIRSVIFIAVAFSILPLECPSQRTPTNVIKQRERNSVSIGLKFMKKQRNTLQRALAFVSGTDPNAYASGFLVGDGLVITSYHVVSGKLSAPKKKMLGFRVDDELEVEAFVEGCRARVVKTEPSADLALLKICDSSRFAKRPTFRTAPDMDEQLFLIAQRVNQKIIRRGSFHGLYNYQGTQYWSARIDGQDGFSGSPVYNNKGEVVGVFCSYDSVQEVALISPGTTTQKFLADYDADTQLNQNPKD
jgi:S1-C subfamily serine protease